MKRQVLFVYAEPDNKEHINKLALKYNLSKSEIVNRLVDSHRTGKRVVFSEKTPKYVKHASEWATKRAAIIAGK